jgi:hypothetical protein
MNRFLNRLCLVFVVTGACSIAQAQSKEQSILSAPLQPVTPSKRGVVFTSRLARQFGMQCSRQSPTGYWTNIAPSQNEVTSLENALPMWMKSQRSHRWDGRWDDRFFDYYFQYGALVRGKKRLIYINALPSSQQDRRQVWRRGPQVVCDGGPNFWGVEFDPQTRRFQNASFNGRL